MANHRNKSQSNQNQSQAEDPNTKGAGEKMPLPPQRPEGPGDPGGQQVERDPGNKMGEDEGTERQKQGNPGPEQGKEIGAEIEDDSDDEFDDDEDVDDDDEDERVTQRSPAQGHRDDDELGK